MRKIFLLVLTVLLGASFMGCQKKADVRPEDKKIVIGSNIYSFADNFMNGVMKPELESYAKAKGAEIQVVDSEGQQAKLNDQVDVFIT
ncbi:MAG: methyl-galactoside ABC transporter substrate-binding protein, partial [Spirochaetaceae bacterium]|nr:methyl-galactoside ABC transporter substrate-binding protein [Spirochaetaceae bacterium]